MIICSTTLIVTCPIDHLNRPINPFATKPSHTIPLYSSLTYTIHHTSTHPHRGVGGNYTLDSKKQSNHKPISFTPHCQEQSNLRTYLIAITPWVSLCPNIHIRVLRTFGWWGKMRLMLPVGVPLDEGVCACEDEGGDDDASGERGRRLLVCCVLGGWWGGVVRWLSSRSG